MTKHVVIGHGGFNPESGSYPPEILVGEGTTLQFFSEAGQALVLPTAKGDYGKVADMWEQVAAEGAPIKGKGVAYNYKLTPDRTEKHRESAEAADWGSGTEVYYLKKGAEYLCEGSSSTCPTPVLNVAASRHDELLAKGDAAVQAFKKWMDGEGSFPEEIADFEARLADLPPNYLEYVADGVPDERWQHHCDGVLGNFKGDEIFWMACTSIMVDTPEMPALDLADQAGPGLSDSSAWVPSKSDKKEIRELNAKNLKATPDGGHVSVAAGGDLVIIGADHNDDVNAYLRRQKDLEQGQITLTKGGAFSHGRLELTGISAKQDLVEKEIGEVSDKKVKFG
jgi:hypothetical protein